GIRVAASSPRRSAQVGEDRSALTLRHNEGPALCRPRFPVVRQFSTMPPFRVSPAHHVISFAGPALLLRRGLKHTFPEFCAESCGRQTLKQAIEARFAVRDARASHLANRYWSA